MIDYPAIAHRYRPRGWRISYSQKRTKERSGLCDYSRRTIYVPYIIDRVCLHVFLHECAHVHLKYWEDTRPRYMMEYDAERWAIETMRREGVPVGRGMIDDARDNVRSHINPWDCVPKHVRRWLK